MQEQYHKLLFGVRRSIRYHLRRCRFFDSIARATSGASLVFGSSTLAMWVEGISTPWLAVLPALVGAASILALVYEAPRMARLHSELARRFIELEQRMTLAPTPDEVSAEYDRYLEQFAAQKLAIELDEPPIHRVLDLLCRNELILAEGHDPAHLYRASRFERLTAQLLHLTPKLSHMPVAHAPEP